MFLMDSFAINLIDKVINHLSSSSLSSSPQTVPITMKSPSQESSSLNSTNSTSRWKRSSPDPSKMMGQIDTQAKRVQATTPQRRASNMERVGSPCLSGYPVRNYFTLIFKDVENKSMLTNFRVQIFVVVH